MNRETLTTAFSDTDAAAAERQRRRDKSSKPVTVEARLKLGNAMELEQAERCAAAADHWSSHSATTGSGPRRQAASGRRIEATPLEWRLEETGKPVLIEGAGCSASFVVIGAPGSGKSHLVSKLIRDIISHAPDHPEKRFGGLLLDPKGAMVGDLEKTLEGHPRCHDFVVIDGSPHQTPFNIISSSLNTRELANLLVLAARSAGIGASDPFWFMAWTNLFHAAMVVLEINEPEPLTLSRLVRSVTTIDSDGKRAIEHAAEELMDTLAYKSARRALVSGASEEIIAAAARQAVSDLHGFYRSRADYVSTIEAFIVGAYGQFRDERCAMFNHVPPGYLAGPSSNIYDQILEDGKIVVVSLTPGEPALSKTLCTLIKCLFQQAVMSRKRRFRDGELHNWDRVVFLACDEYSEIASEVPGQPIGDGRFFALARENGCLGILATQSVHVLENSSLREAWRSVFSNFAAKIFMGLADVETARQATELAGKLDWHLRVPSSSQSSDGVSVSAQREMRERDAVPTCLLTHTLRVGDALIIGSLDGRATPPQVTWMHVDA